ncbi:DUF58 domain-containing protein [Nostocoides sp. HKS02]|uniref:DUF58 domain-containing protein n=1 Tax=Nostocoides sp. HKS02 TaxID=1813880 RepID=UPI0012B4ACDB|nr:DUF58 domain-containing protein [Tetrasphaera sp. HKS02]QGN56896.1 DUF58 domain-containing protein [Tetrasphaera sp. HKS02]
MSVALTRAAPTTRVDVVCQSMRWGNRPLGPATVALTGAFGAYAWEPELVRAAPLPTVPLPDTFSARVPVPRPDGLVGRSRSAHHGDGGELAQIRPFRYGDRLRRVHWPVSVRTGELHVTATHADQDTEILLLLDATHDLGASEGIGGASSSLDNAVRAAGALAEHYLRTGDRVGLLVLGARDLPRVTAAAGSGHLRRLLDVLARVQVADSTVSDEKRLRSQLRHPVGAGTLAVVLTPAISPEVLAHAVSLSRRGISVVAVDTLPRRSPRAPSPPSDSPSWWGPADPKPPGSRGGSASWSANARCSAPARPGSPSCPGPDRAPSTWCCATSAAGRGLREW